MNPIHRDMVLVNMAHIKVGAIHKFQKEAKVKKKKSEILLSFYCFSYFVDILLIYFNLMKSNNLFF